MKSRFIAFLGLAAILLSAVAFAGTTAAQTSAKAREASRIVSLLPASDGVVVIESKRALTEALPRLFAGNQNTLAVITAKLTEMEQRTGIDLRKFDQVAVGVAIKEISAKETDFEPVAIASGDINAGALVAVARLASKGTYREEKVNGTNVYVFVPKDVMQKTAPVQATNSKLAGFINDGLGSFSKEVAVANLDNNTIVIGSLNRVRETLGKGSKISADVSSLLSAKDTAVVSFAFRNQGALTRLLPVDLDMLGSNIKSIQYLSGSIDVTAAATSLSLMARTAKAEQATGLKETLDGLQMLGKAFLGAGKRADQQVYSRMVNNVTFNVSGNDLLLNLSVPQADIDILISGVK